MRKVLRIKLSLASKTEENNFQQIKLPQNKNQIKEVTMTIILKTTLIKGQIMTSDKFIYLFIYFLFVVNSVIH